MQTRNRRSKYDRIGYYYLPEMVELIVMNVDAKSKNPSDDFDTVIEDVQESDTIADEPEDEMPI